MLFVWTLYIHAGLVHLGLQQWVAGSSSPHAQCESCQGSCMSKTMAPDICEVPKISKAENHTCSCNHSGKMQGNKAVQRMLNEVPPALINSHTSNADHGPRAVITTNCTCGTAHGQGEWTPLSADKYFGNTTSLQNAHFLAGGTLLQTCPGELPLFITEIFHPPATSSYTI